MRWFGGLFRDPKREALDVRRAAAAGDLEALEALRARSVSILADDEEDALTALHFAAMAGRAATVTHLVQAGADVNALRKNRFAPLHAAAMNGHDGVVRMLLDAGARPSPRTEPQGYSPLHSAAWAGHEAAVRVLLDAGALVGARNQRGESPAETARRQGHASLADEIDAWSQPPSSGCPIVTDLAWGRIDCRAGGFKDARLHPRGAEEWDWRRTGTRHRPGVQLADVADLLDAGATTVILSRGVDLVLQNPAATIEAVEARGIRVMSLQTDLAVAEYNRRIRSERVVAVMHSTC